MEISKDVRRGSKSNPLTFTEVYSIFREEREQQALRAAKVFDMFINGDVGYSELIRGENGEPAVATFGSKGFDSAIKESLDAKSIPYFVDMVLEHGKKAEQSSNAMKRHAENHAMKADVFAWLDDNRVNFRSMDSAAESVSKDVVPIAVRTARKWVGEWKKLRSTGTA